MGPFDAPFIITKSPKSIGLGIFLALVFGPLGLFYSSVTGGLVMTFTPIVALAFLIVGFFKNDPLMIFAFGSLVLLFICFWWLICMIWAAIGVAQYNSQIEEDYKRQQERYIMMKNSTQMNFSSQIENRSQENYELQSWLREHPGKSINDFYSAKGKS